MKNTKYSVIMTVTVTFGPRPVTAHYAGFYAFYAFLDFW
jgi:hypothetical protein